MAHRHTRRLIASVGVTVLLAVPLSGCQQMAEKAVEEATGGDVKIKDGGKDISIKGPDGGEVNIQSSTKLPADWPKDVPVPEGAKIVNTASTSGPDGESLMNLVIETSQSAEELSSEFKQSLESNGWKIETQSTSGDGATLQATKTDPERSTVVLIGSTDGKTTATVTVGEKSG